MAKLRIAPIVLALGLLVAACGGSSDDSGSSDSTTSAVATAATVAIKDLKFNPDKVSIKAGEAVTWEWKESVVHNVSGDGIKSGNRSDGTFKHTFAKAGTYDYQCTLHAGMNGSVEVS